MRRSGNAVSAPPNAVGSVAPGDVASAAWPGAQLLLFAAAGASLGAVVASYSKSPQKPVLRNAAIGAVVVPLVAVI